MEALKHHIFLDEDKDDIGNNIYDFELLCYLGGGNNYHYAKVKSKLNNKIYIMKIFTNIQLERYKTIEKKLFMLKLMNHPNMLKYYSSFIDNNNYYIIMEYAENGNLKNYIKIHKLLNKKIEESILNKILYQSMSVLEYLHREGFLHRNITTSNLFLTKNGDVKLGGFEYLCKGGNNSKENKPVNNLYNLVKIEPLEDDFYSLGLIFYNLRNLHPNHIYIPNVSNNKRVYSIEVINSEEEKVEENKGKKKGRKKKIKKEENKNTPELYMIKQLDTTKRDELIIKNYNRSHLKNTYSSIESVYFCLNYLLGYPGIEINDAVNNRRININEFNSKGPISKSLSILDLSYLKDILIENSEIFRVKEEINPCELIKFIIKQLHIENNKSGNKYSRVYSLSNGNNDFGISKEMEEKKRNDFKFNLILSRYEYLYNLNFNSIISDKKRGLYGTYQIQNYCKNCKETNYYFESFYYITIDLDSAESDIKIKDYLDNKDIIKTYKFCQNCKNITEQTETKIIFRFPCRLIIFLKNYTQKNDLTTSISLKESNYLLVATINYNKNEYKYDYSYNIYNGKNGQIMIHNNPNIQYNNINSDNIVAMFYLYVGGKELPLI